MKDVEIDIYGKITKPQIIDPSDDPGRRPPLNPVENKKHHIDGLMQERRNSIIKVLEPSPLVPIHQIILYKVTNEFDKWIVVIWK